MQRIEAHAWFLRRGLPAVLPPGSLARRLWPRAAPTLAAFAVFMANSVAVVAITDEHTIDIAGQPTRDEWFILGLLVLVLPVAAAAGWWVSRVESLRTRTAAAAISVLISILGAVFGGPSPRLGLDLVYVGVVIAVIIASTASGLGSILGWALNATAHNLALAGTLFVRALPVLLLTVLAFFNTYMWLMASIVSRTRLLLALGFLGVIAVAFITSATVERVRPMLTATDRPDGDDPGLAATPFHGLPAPEHRIPVTRIERVNVVFVLVVSQVLQVLMVAIITALIFFVLGLILLNPTLLAEWTRNGSAEGELLGMTLPIPQALIQISMFLGGLTFMYVSARAVGDAEYRVQFLAPLIEDLRVTLDARDRYRLATDIPAGRP
jgi:hypothetical protein